MNRKTYPSDIRRGRLQRPSATCASSTSTSRTAKQSATSTSPRLTSTYTIRTPGATKSSARRPERQALADILALGYRDAYRNLHPDTVQYSWWDYRMGGLRRNIGMRIDLTLCSDNLALHDAGIDTAPRHWERPSDHAPAWVAIKN